VYPHRSAAEAYCGWKLYCYEIVHHIDFDRDNNDPSNLQIVTQEQHERIHSSEPYKSYLILKNGLKKSPDDEWLKKSIEAVKQKARENACLRNIVSVMERFSPSELAQECEHRRLQRNLDNRNKRIALKQGAGRPWENLPQLPLPHKYPLHQIV